VLAIAASGPSPEARIVLALPAALAWNPIEPALLVAFGAVYGTTLRLGWLADVALTIDRVAGFPGGCHQDLLSEVLGRMPLVGMEGMRIPPWDDLGRPSRNPPRQRAWKYWFIRFDATLDDFRERAASLAEGDIPDVYSPAKPTNRGGKRRGPASRTDG